MGLVRIEKALLTLKKHKALRKLMSLEYRCLSSPSSRDLQMKWVNRKYQELLKGTTIREREIYLTEEICALEKDGKLHTLSQEKIQRLKGYKEECKNLDLEWWLHIQELKRIQHSQPTGPCVPYFRVIDLVCPWVLKHKFKLRGGCCNFDCGGCTPPRVCSRGTFEGHCSAISCPCCIHRRGCEDVPN